MIREEEFVMSHRQFALDLGSWQETERCDEHHYSYYQINAVWYRPAPRGRVKACLGHLRALMSDPLPAGVQEFLDRYKSDPYGGRCAGRWDGERYWGAQELGTMSEHLEILRPMVEFYPALPGSYNGWWRF